MRCTACEGPECNADPQQYSCGMSRCKRFDFNICMPFRFYDGRLAKSLRNIFLGHESLFLARGGDLRPDVAATCKSIREFDDAITRVTFGAF